MTADDDAPTPSHAASTGRVTGAFPPYTYVPGRAPHPINDPLGHSFQQHPVAGGPPESGDWTASAEFRRGIEFFNAGYYWEAHEAWEAVWVAAGRRGADAEFVQALIKLAAAGVKRREGREAGVQRHLRRAIELLRGVCGPSFDALPRFGLSCDELLRDCEQALRDPPPHNLPADCRPRIVFNCSLQPRKT